MIPVGFVRASKSRPCPVCHKPDWCLVGVDGDRAVCARIHSSHRFGEKAGWLHILSSGSSENDRLPEWSAARRAELAAAHAKAQELEDQARSSIDFAALARQFAANLDNPRAARLADELGLTEGVLRELGTGETVDHIGRAHMMPRRDGKPRSVVAWSFPMKNGCGEIIGLRLRGRDGSKFSYTYSEPDGLFIPTGITSIVGPAGILFCPEGPTSTAALRALGLRAVGRPNNRMGGRYLLEYCRRLRPCRVVIVGDNDSKADGSWPGREGADEVASLLQKRLPYAVSVMLPPEGIKDVRDWRALGAGRSDVLRRARLEHKGVCA